MAKLYLIREGSGEKIPISSAMVIGRTRECNLVLEDPAVSRRHFEIVPRENGIYLKDLGSTNGTYVNGHRLSEGLLRPGDCIQVGRTVLKFEVEENNAPSKFETDRNLDHSVVERSFLSLELPKRLKKLEKDLPVALETLYSVLNDIAGTFDICELQNGILESTSKILPISHGAILFTNSENEIIPCKKCGKVHQLQGKDIALSESSQVKVSSTLVSKVVKARQSILYKDIVDDEDMRNAISIMSLNVRSAMCVPLRSRNRVLGLIYFDCSEDKGKYTEADLLLVSAIGNSAGLAFENAEFHEQLIEKYRLEQEVKTAGIIQTGFLFNDWSSLPEACDIYAKTLPAKIVGGDFFDVVKISDNMIAFAVGDVSGKGIPSALAMVKILTMFRTQVVRQESELDLIKILNTDLVRSSQEGMFCSLVLGILDINTGELRCVNAGHLPGLLIRDEKLDFIFHPSGPPLGIVDKDVWKVEREVLHSSDCLVLVTDGITEARRGVTGKNLSDREFGFHRLRKCIDKHKTQTPKEIVSAVLENVKKYASPELPHDDCTIFVLKWNGYA
ncbi:MAG: SpoIIE family protein phosphatase [Candidatus Hydrogenedentes bacterium]|nr:SpoIIE family protein phosphatase [Candidatus Hydrogenedentota bacterium]